MTLLIKLENNVPTGFPVVEQNFKLLFPNASFPTYLTPESVEPFGFGLYDYSQIPQIDKYKKLVEVAPKKDSNNIWRQSWDIVDMNDAEKKEADSIKATEIRNIRNFKLSICDWTQLNDSPVNKEAWAVYRQQLRDITSQTGFPWEVIWPTTP